MFCQWMFCQIEFDPRQMLMVANVLPGGWFSHGSVILLDVFGSHEMLSSKCSAKDMFYVMFLDNKRC